MMTEARILYRYGIGVAVLIARTIGIPAIAQLLIHCFLSAIPTTKEIIQIADKTIVSFLSNLICTTFRKYSLYSNRMCYNGMQNITHNIRTRSNYPFLISGQPEKRGEYTIAIFGAAYFGRCT